MHQLGVPSDQASWALHQELAVQLNPGGSVTATYNLAGYVETLPPAGSYTSTITYELTPLD